MCTISSPMQQGEHFEPIQLTGPLNSANFRRGVVLGLINETSGVESITVEKLSESGKQDTLRMYLKDANGNVILNTSFITAAFPCPRACLVNENKILNLPTTTFCANQVLAIMSNTTYQSNGLAFHIMTNGMLGMYGVIINEINYNHTRFNVYSVHSVYKA